MAYPFQNALQSLVRPDPLHSVDHEGPRSHDVVLATCLGLAWLVTALKVFQFSFMTTLSETH